MAQKRGPKEEPKTDQLPTPIAATGGGEGGDGGGDDRNLSVVSLEGSSEVQAAVLMAKKFPRDERLAQDEILAICDQPIFAEGAFYSFPRGRKLDEKTGEWKQNIVTGPSIRMAREAARVYGNFRYGFVISHEDDDGRQIIGYAWDVQKNNRTTSSDYFKKLILRRVGTGREATTIPVTPDERELRELTNRRASILMRNCVLSLLPAYFVDRAVEICRKTAGGGGGGKPGAPATDLVERIEKMKAAFGELGITQIQIETYLKKPVLQATSEDLGDLRGIYESLADGVISPQERAEMFGGGSGSQEQAKGPGIDTPKLSEQDMKPATSSANASFIPGPGEPGAPFPLHPGTQPSTTKEKELTQAPLPERTVVITEEQRKALMSALRKTKKYLKDLEDYGYKAGWDIDKPMTADQYQDALGFASFIPPAKEKPPKATAPAAKSNGEDGTADPKARALKLISEMTEENKLNLRVQVIGLCNLIKGTDNIVEVTVALGKKEKEIELQK